MAINSESLEQEIQNFGREIIEFVDQTSQSIFTREFYNSWLLDWSMKNPAFKTRLFRFIDVLPVLDNDLELVEHAREYFSQVADSLPAALKTALYLKPGRISSRLAAPIIRQQVENVADSFISGGNIELAMPKLSALLDEERAFITCFLGDAVLSKNESLAYRDKYLSLIETLSSQLINRRSFLKSYAGHRGLRHRAQISVKLSTLYSQARPLNHGRSVDTLTERFLDLALKAKENKCALCIDMEESHFVPVALETLSRVLSDSKLVGWDGLGIVLQAYAKRTENDLEQLISFSKKHDQPLSIRLVKGAYWDYESMVAEQNGWANPLFIRKSSTDANYEKLSKTLLDNSELIYSAFGSHNIRSLASVAAYARLRGVDTKNFEFQFLYGMAEPIKDGFAQKGYLTRDYVPIGELIPGMGYLVRRLLENTSNEGFLRQKFHEDETPEQLLAKPIPDEPSTTKEKYGFQNESPLDLSLEKDRSLVSEAIQTALSGANRGPKVIKPIIKGRQIACSNLIETRCPSEKSLKIGKINLSSLSTLNDCVQSLAEGFANWSSTRYEDRIEVFKRMSNLLAKQKESFIAELVIEIGKSIEEADGEVAEAIDFINYYCEQAQRMYLERGVLSLPGEDNRLVYKARGVTAVIGPWNFPLAIPCGMMTAALITGNSVLLKPAEQASIVAKKLYDLAIEAGVPSSALAFLPGLGEEIGDSLVRHPDVVTIAFTGSKAVGLRINQLAASAPSEKQIHVKRVIAEMGGKNATIVDSDADLDQAVSGVLKASFGFQGQKCSACSRAIIVSPTTYQKFKHRLVQALDSLEIGPAWEPDKVLGPLVNAEHLEHVRKIVEETKGSCKKLYEYPQSPELDKDYFLRADIFDQFKQADSIWTKEVFGPVLAITVCDSFEKALELANDSRFGLTGSVYSRNPKNLERAKKFFQAGNLYINRKSTGAIVGRQPFGGAKMSGLGTKAGGPDYLKEFVNTQCLTENTFRSGFLPELL